MIDRCYVVVGDWMSRGLQAAQAGHAIVELCTLFPTQAAEWRNTHNVLIILEGSPANAITGISNQLKKWDVTEQPPYANFEEPDFNNMMTALAFFHEDTPGGECLQRALSSYPLMNKRPRTRRDERRRVANENRTRQETKDAHDSLASPLY
jgi:hypothetical protein